MGPPGGSPPPAAVARVAGKLAALVESGRLDRLPLPGSGRTAERWAALAALAEEDCALGRLAEGHADALAVLAELEGPPVPPRARLGVWAAGPPGDVVATPRGGGWSLKGRRAWCSGASSLTHALVTGILPDLSPALFLLDCSTGARALPRSWPAVGMAASDTLDVELDGASASGPVGAPGAYLHRPGFWHGSMGVAACWWGGARGLLPPLLARAALGDPHAAAHLGAVEARRAATEAFLSAAAAAVDADPADHTGGAERLALSLRHVTEEAASELLGRVGRATGAGPLGHDAEHARRAADLTVYLRQSHAEADLERLGRLVAGGGADPLPGDPDGADRAAGPGGEGPR